MKNNTHGMYFGTILHGNESVLQFYTMMDGEALLAVSLLSAQSCIVVKKTP